jgi:hypothetical protein
VSDVHVYPREFEWCLELLTRRLSETAARAGVPDAECTNLEAILAALPPFSRSNAEGFLTNLQLQACDDFPAMAFAAKYVRKLASEIWFCSPVSLALMATTADPTERLYDEKRGTGLPLAAF